MIYVQIKIWKARARANRTEIHVGKFCVHQVLGKEPPNEERHSVLMLSFSLQGRFTTVSRAPVLPGENKCLSSTRLRSCSPPPTIWGSTNVVTV